MSDGTATAAPLAGRDELSGLLRLAATIEHALLCEYLFAAFSMKRTVAEGGVTYEQIEMMRRWEGNLNLVARQEMEHLGIVMNMRTAIGDASSMRMPPFPFETRFEGIPLRFALTPMTQETMIGFALMEMPDRLPPTSPYYQFLAAECPDFDPDRVDGIARLYNRIGELFEEIPEEALFIGPPGAQIETGEVFKGAIRGIDAPRSNAYGVKMHTVYDRASALSAVAQIAEEGEGAHHEGGPGSHFSLVMDALIGLKTMQDADPDFVPARPVVTNPSLARPDGDVLRDGATLVDAPAGAKALRIFEIAYETTLIGLSRFFTQPVHGRDEMDAVQQAVFFPMMTTIIRPLGEILTLLPAGGAPGTAGASFNAPGAVEAPSRPSPNFHQLYARYERMGELANDLAEDVKSGAAPLPDWADRNVIYDRVRFLAEQIERSGYNLKLGYEAVLDGE